MSRGCYEAEAARTPRLLLVACSIWLVSCTGGVYQNRERVFFKRHAAPTKPGLLKCHFFDTDTGDAALLVLPSGEIVVIDAGTGSGGDRAIRRLETLGIERLDVAILSHPDYDHYGGFGRVVRRFPPREFYHSGFTSWTPAYRAFRREIQKTGCTVREVRKGDRIPLGGDVECSVLWPPRGIEPDSTSLHFANTNSLVLKVRLGDVSFLFCGDIKSDTEAALVKQNRKGLRANVLKVAHHGSASSSSREFLEAVGPQLAVITGEEGNLERGAFRKAAPATVRRLEEVGSRMLRVCHTGSLLIETDGRGITKLDTARGCVPSEAETVRARDPRWAVPVERAGLPNLHRVSEALYRGAQPEPEGIVELRKMGVRTVVDLRKLHSDRDEIGDVEIGYEHIGMNPWHPEDEDVVRFLEIVTDPERQPIFVHCQHGADRTGLMCAIYRVVVEGWTKEEAIDEMQNGGFGFHSIWQSIPKFLRELDVERAKREAALVSP